MNLRQARKLLREYARFFLNNGVGGKARGRFAPQLIRRTLELEYIRWPKRLQPHVRGRDVLDVGCGMGLHGVGFVVAGVRSYTGCDPILSLDSDVVKNLRTGQRDSCGWTPRQMMASFPQLRYLPGEVNDLATSEQWDVVVLHNTTEHLIGIAQVFALLCGALDQAVC